MQASFLTQLPQRKETTQGFHHEANADFKTVSLMTVIRKNEIGSTTLTLLHNTDLHDRVKRWTLVQNKHFLKHASCLQRVTKVNCQKGGKETLCPEYKVLCLGQIQHNTSLSTTRHIFKHDGGCIMCHALAIERLIFSILVRPGCD